MDDHDSQSATVAPATAARDGSPMPSLVTTPSTNASLSPRTPASPPFSSVSDSPQKAFPSLNIGATPAAGALDFSPSPNSGTGPTSPGSDALSNTSNRYKTLNDAFANRAQENLAHDISVDDLTIADDGSYLETSSAHAARELKRRYDRQLGVGIKPGVRSPYAITVIQDAQGQPLYRLSSSRPGNGVSVNEAEPSAPSAVPEPMSKSRRLRLSVGALLTSKTSRSPAAGPNQQTPQMNKAISSTPRKPPARLVRTVRSTSELRSRSGSAAGPLRYGKQPATRPTALDDTAIIARLAHDGDAFSVLLGWSLDPDSESVSSSKDSIDSQGTDEEEFGSKRSPLNEYAHPFGRGVAYTTPQRPLDFSMRRPSSPPQLRYMQSFESGLTARADDHPAFIRPSKRMTSATHASASPYSTEVFDVIQNYKGIPLADTLSAVATETVFKLSSTPSALPKNDPRFVIWGDVRYGGEEDEDTLSQSDASSPTSETKEEQHRRRRGSSVTESQSSAASVSGAREPLGQRVIVAATIERWIAQLTSELNYVELLDFFLTYRVYISAIDLCHLLISRFHWAVEAPDSKQDEMVKKIVRVRTFIAFRYWLSTFFQVDFLRNRELCKILTTWLNSLKADQGIVGQNQDVLDIVRKLKKIVRECKEKWVMKSSTASTAGSSETRLSEHGANGGGDMADNPDADVDLDMEDRQPRPSVDGNSISALSLNPPPSFHGNQPMLPDLSNPSRPSDVSTSTISPIHLPNPHPTTSGLSQLHDLQATILAQAKPAVHLKSTGQTTSVTVATPTLPMHQSAISRALVNTMGRLGRWKRVLHGRSAVGVAACNDPAAFDMDWGSDSDREFGSIRPTVIGSQRGAAFPSHTMPSSPPQRRLLGGSGWSTLSVRPARRSVAEEEDAVIEEISREANARATPSTSATPAIVPARRLLRTASAIPLNPKLLAEMEVVPSHPEMDATHQLDGDEESSPATPTPGAVARSLAAPSTDSDNEPSAPPGLNVSSASPRRVLHRPSSSLSMRRIGEFRSSPLAPHPELRSTTAVADTPATVPEVEERSHAEGDLVQEPIVPPGLTMPVHTPAVDVMDAHSAHTDDFDSLVDDDDDFHRRPEIVSLDDFDLSSSGSDSEGEPQRQRRPLRRLPNRRDFEFVRRSIDSVSSMGIRSSDAHSSIASGSEVSSNSRASQTGPVYEGEILPWHLDLIEDSDDDQPQDAEAALARLEGHLDANAQKEKLKKVDRWMKMVAARMAAGDTSLAGLFADLKEEAEEEETSAPTPSSTSDAGQSNPVSEVGDIPEPVSAGGSSAASVVEEQEQKEKEKEKPVLSVSVEKPVEEAQEDALVEEHTIETDGAEDTTYVDSVHQQREALGAITPTPPPMNGKADRLPLTPTLTSPGEVDEDGEVPPPSASTATADTPVVPSSRIPIVSEIPKDSTTRANKRRTHGTSTLMRKADILLMSKAGSKIPVSPSVALHRSFILLHRSEAIAQHFAMIDRELFLTVKFNEIVSGSWADPRNDVGHGDMIEWQAYVKERARKKLARKTDEGPEISAIAALRARFNMMVAFAATDIVMAHPAERAIVFNKFLRIAWKSYLLNNFAAVVAIITSLQTPMVAMSMKRFWGRVGMWEMRVFEDLKEFSSPRGNFKFIRDAIAALIDQRDDSSNGMASAQSSVSSRAAKMPADRGVAPASCIPFIGMYLADLHRYRKLPDYIDPTSPSSRVEGPNGEFRPPRYPEVFSTLAPLPPSVPLEPLANVQKQRLTAGTVKEIVAGQHLASKISFDLDRKLYQKCLRLKAVPPDKLVEVAKKYGGET